MKLTTNIDLRELVPRATYTKYGNRSVRFLNAQLIHGMQWIIDRHCIETTTINNWLWGGKRQQSGLRIKGQSHYRGDGLHDHGNAIDSIPKIKGKSTVKLLRNIHQDAIDNPRLYWEKGIWRIETIWLASGWLHIDSMFTPDQTEVVFIDLTSRYTAEEYLQELKKRGL